jgi:hypothetical protein
MPKNNIFESIENNEIVKNLVDDSKKIFDEFLGLVQGKKIREGNTALSEGTSEGTSAGTSAGTYVAEYALRDFTKWKTSVDNQSNLKTCYVNINDININSVKIIPKSDVLYFLNNSTSGITDPDVFIDLLILSSDNILGKLENIIDIDELCIDKLSAEKISGDIPLSDDNYYLLTCIPKSDEHIRGALGPHLEDESLYEKTKNLIGNMGSGSCLLEATKGSVMTVCTKNLGLPQFNVLFLAKNGFLHTFNYNPAQDWNFFEKTAVVINPEYGYYNYTTPYYSTNNYTDSININIDFNNKDLKFKIQNNEWGYYNTKVPNRLNFSWTGNKNANSNISDRWHTILIFALTQDQYIWKLNINSDITNNDPIQYNYIDINNQSDFNNRIHSLQDNGILCYSEFLGCFNDWPERTGGFTKEYHKVTNNNQTQAMHDANQIAIDQGKDFFTIQWENQVFMPERKDINMQLMLSVKSIQNWLVGIENEWWNDFFKWWIQDIENWIDDIYNVVYDTDIDENFHKKFHELPVNYKNKDFAEARSNTGKHECQYDPDSGYIRGGAWANAFYKTMPNEKCFEYRDVYLILDDTGLYIERVKDTGSTPEKLYIYRLTVIDYNKDLIPNPDWKNKGYAHPNGKMKYNEFLCPRSYHRNEFTGEIIDTEYITDINCKMRCFVDLVGTIHIECNFNTCSPNFKKIVTSIGTSYCNSTHHTSIYNPLIPSGSIYNSISYIYKTFYEIKEKESLNNNIFSNIEAVYLKFKVDNPNDISFNAFTNDKIKDGKTFYYKLNKNNNMQNCDMKNIPNALVFNPANNGMFKSVLGSLSKSSLIDTFPNIDNISQCNTKCLNSPECYLATYSESPKQCNLYNKNIGEYIFDNNNISDSNKFSEKVYAKFCGPYSKDSAGNYDQNLLNANLINTLITPSNSSFSQSNHPLKLTKVDWDPTTHRDPIVDSIPETFIYKNDTDIIKNIKNSNCYKNDISKILKLDNIDKIPEYLIEQYGYPIIPFAKINNPTEEIKNYYNSICSVLRSNANKDITLTSTIRSRHVLASQSGSGTETFTNINELNESIKYTYFDNNVLHKIDNDTKSINELIYNFNKYLYKNKYDLKSGRISQNHFFDVNNIILTIFTIVFVIILIRLIYKKK